MAVRLEPVPERDPGHGDAVLADVVEQAGDLVTLLVVERGDELGQALELAVQPAALYTPSQSGEPSPLATPAQPEPFVRSR